MANYKVYQRHDNRTAILKNKLLSHKKNNFGVGMNKFFGCERKRLVMIKKIVTYCFSALLFGCSSSDVPQISDQSYFPLRVGDFRIYQVNETDILRLTCSGNGQTVRNYQLKELISDSAKNTEGSYTYTIHRYTRLDSTQPWLDLDTWTARTNNKQVVVNEGNVPYVKFTFPLVDKTVWNINSYNDLGKDYDTLRNFHQPYTLITGEKFQNTFSARRDSGEFIVYFDRRLEVYAPSVGLINKEIRQLHYFNNPNDPCYGHQVVKNGTIYLQSLISYGHQ